MPRRHRLLTSMLSILGAVALAALAGCKSIGPSKLVDTHQGYNDAVQLALSREMLLNVVRMRFGDPVQFLEVSQINAQFSVGVTASGGVGNIGGAGGAVGSASGQVSYSDSPTLTFMPRDDDQFGRDLLLPVHLYDAITFTNRGGSYDISFLALITSGINDAPDLPGPNGELYRKRLKVMRALLKTDLAWIAHGKRWVPSPHTPIADVVLRAASSHTRVTADALLDVDQHGPEVLVPVVIVSGFLRPLGSSRRVASEHAHADGKKTGRGRQFRELTEELPPATVDLALGGRRARLYLLIGL